jgi:hypothetical protein
MVWREAKAVRDENIAEGVVLRLSCTAQRFPLTFVVKSVDDAATVMKTIEEQAFAKYKINAVVKSYLDAIEEIINIPILLDRLNTVLHAGNVPLIMEEIITQSRVEFNYAAQDELEAEEDADLLASLDGEQ